MTLPGRNRNLPRHTWVIRESDPDQALGRAERLATELGCSPLLARVLLARGLDTAEKAGRFMRPSEDAILPPEAIPGIETARDRLLNAIRNREPVMIHGDYDADGIIGAVIMHQTLRDLGCPSRIFLPSREKHGFGLALQAVQKAAKADIPLIVSVDCGISSHETIHAAREAGIEVIVTDHHSLPETLPSDALLVHPELEGDYPGGKIAGATVAYKLALALMAALDRDTDEIKERLLPLVALATVADVCPLVDENRALVSVGMGGIPTSKVPGLRTLFLGTRRDVSHEPVTVRDLAFYMAPCLNAAGRMGDPFPAAKLLLAKDEDTAWRCFRALQQLNRDRKRTQAETFRRLMNRPEITLQLSEGGILAFADPDCSPGLTGLAAMRLAEHAGKPACILGPGTDENGNIYRGSMRTSGGEDLLELMGPVRDFADRMGGHPGAIGLTVREDRLDGFLHACRNLDWTPKSPELVLDIAVDAPPTNPEEVLEFDSTRPWGEGNPQPSFAWGPVTIEHTRAVGREGDHLQVGFQAGDGSRLKGIGFSMGRWFGDDEAVGRLVRAAGHFILNEWQGSTSVEFQLTDIDPM